MPAVRFQAATAILLLLLSAVMAAGQAAVPAEAAEAVDLPALVGLTVAEANRIIEEAEKAEQLQIKAPPSEKKIPTREDKIRALRKALDEGRITQEMYEENLRRIQ